LVTHRADGLECTEVTASGRGRALGIPTPGNWPAHRVELPVPWTVVLYTDGLVEAKMIPDDEAVDLPERLPRLGVDGLREVVVAELAASEGDVVPRVLRRVRGLHGGPLAD